MSPPHCTVPYTLPHTHTTYHTPAHSSLLQADEDDLEAAREIVNDARKFVKDNPKASMTEVISQQLEMDTSLRPILERYVGTGATIADMFTLANSFV